MGCAARRYRAPVDRRAGAARHRAPRRAPIPTPARSSGRCRRQRWVHRSPTVSGPCRISASDVPGAERTRAQGRRSGRADALPVPGTIPVRAVAAKEAKLALSPLHRVVSWRRALRWLGRVHSADPVRRALNSGLAWVLLSIALLAVLMSGVLVTIGRPALTVGIVVITAPLCLVCWWLNRRGSA